MAKRRSRDAVGPTTRYRRDQLAKRAYEDAAKVATSVAPPASEPPLAAPARDHDEAG